MKKEDLDRYLFDYSIELGFCGYGAIPAHLFTMEREYLERSLLNNYNGSMTYLSRNMEIRENPALLLEGARSIIVLLIPYKPAKKQLPEYPGIASYAYGEDYHGLVKERLRMLASKLNLFYPDARYRVFTDSAPIFEKALAVKAGLGFIGRNTLLINKREGLHTFIGVIITDVPLKYNEEIVPGGCGSCRRCLDACPTGALVSEYVLDSRLCISYRTIECKNEEKLLYPEIERAGMIFGCDRCLDACPWTTRGEPTEWPGFLPLKYHNGESILTLDNNEWQSMTEETFSSVFKKSPLSRAGLSKIKSNLNSISKSQKK